MSGNAIDASPTFERREHLGPSASGNLMPMKFSRRHRRNLLVLGLCAAALSALPAMAHAQSAAPTAQPASTEMEAVLFVQSLPTKDGQDAIQLVWIPEPLQQLCLGKTTQQCSAMDYCVRTTNRDVSLCRNLGMPLSRLPSYPSDMSPRRLLSVALLRLTPDRFARLQDFYRGAPRASLQRLSLSARVQARVRLTRTPKDDDLYVLDILAVAPF
jgi:hypothetical protein